MNILSLSKCWVNKKIQNDKVVYLYFMNFTTANVYII